MTLEELLRQIHFEGYRLSHLGESGPEYYAYIAKGQDPRINTGSGNARGPTPFEAMTNAFEAAKKNAEDIANGKYRTATTIEKLDGEKEVASLLDELLGD